MPTVLASDTIEALAMLLFKRDHPERAWRARTADVFIHGAGFYASAEERKLYKAFARGRLYEDTGAGEFGRRRTN